MPTGSVNQGVPLLIVVAQQLRLYEQHFGNLHLQSARISRISLHFYAAAYLEYLCTFMRGGQVLLQCHSSRKV